ncbi:MAG: hypothetical protein AAGF24_10400 [Cyanobacteria bacterium P01_H01_bin.121]
MTSECRAAGSGRHYSHHDASGKEPPQPPVMVTQRQASPRLNGEDAVFSTLLYSHK